MLCSRLGKTLNCALAQREPITGREVWVNITFCDSLSCGWNCSKTPKLIPLITGANSRSSQPLCIELCIACSSPTECMAELRGEFLSLILQDIRRGTWLETFQGQSFEAMDPFPLPPGYPGIRFWGKPPSPPVQRVLFGHPDCQLKESKGTQLPPQWFGL